MIICPNCGAENLFDGASQCKKCQSQFGQTNLSSSSKANETQPVSALIQSEMIDHSNSEEMLLETQIAPSPLHRPTPPSEPGIDFEIKEVDFGSAPKHNFDEEQTGIHDSPLSGQSPSPETPTTPETIQKELTLYRDDDLQVRMEQTENGPAITLTNRVDFENEEPESIQRLESIIPELTKDDLPTPSSEEEGNVTNKIFINPNLAKKPRLDLNNPNVEKAGTDKVPVASAIEEDQHHKVPSEFLPKISGEQFKTKGVAYFSGNIIKVMGVKLADGEFITVGDKEYELEPKRGNRWPFYAMIVGGILLLVMLAIFVIISTAKSTGQVVGVVKDPATGQLITSGTVIVKELGTKATISQAGFFVFDNIPEGIYTLEINPDGYDALSEHLTVMKHMTSTASFSLPTMEPTNSAPPQNRHETPPQANGDDNNGILKLSLTPANTKVYLDQRLIGTGSQTFRISLGKHSLTLRSSGYKDASQDFEITDNGSKTLTLSLEKNQQALPIPQKSDIDIASELEGSGKFNEALKYFQDINRKDPTNVEAFFGQARCFRAKGDTENGLSAYLKAAKAASDKKNTKTQLEALSGVLEINPNYLTALYSRGSIYFSQGDYVQAASDFSKVIEIDSRHLNAHYKLAEAYYKSKNYTAALQTYDNTLNLNFTDPKPYAYMAEIYLEMGDIKNTRRYYDKFDKGADIPTRNRFAADPDWQRVKSAVGK